MEQLIAPRVGLRLLSGIEAGFCRYLTEPIAVQDSMNALDAPLALAALGIPRYE